MALASHVPSQPSSLENIHEFVNVGNSKDEDDFKRVIPSMELRKIETFFELVEAHSSNLNRWIGQAVIGEIIRCWITGLPPNSHQKCSYSVIRFCVLAENVKIILRLQELGKTIASESSSKSPEYRPYYDMGKPMKFVWKIYVRKTTIEIREGIKIMVEEKGLQPSQFQDRIIFMSMHNDNVY